MYENGKRGCWYCVGKRTRCVCAEDCGARPGNKAGECHVCAKAPLEVRREWLRSTGMYYEKELKEMT